MKQTISTLAALVLGIGGLMAQKKEDVKSIKAMEGCYRVDFNFAETFHPRKDYEKAKNYTSRGYEWIKVVEDTPNKIVLQHIFIADTERGQFTVKHWRQDWMYENTDLYLFDKDNHWKYKKLDKKDVKGQWTQVVYQVDDAPRYSASGSWVHLDGKNYWQTNADAPMPRRDLKDNKRTDYNVLNRTNKQEIFDWGWLHEQDNKKLLRKDGEKDVVIVEEKGLEYYRKTDASKCQIAKDYWNKYAPIWKTVRNTWDEAMARKKDLYVLPDKPDIYLYEPLMKLTPDQHAEAKKLVEDYILK